VFEPFFTTKDVGKGTGLGLSMVYGFIKQSNGHIKIYSELGHGTCVKIYLPAGEGHHEPVEIGPVATMDRGKERILVAEDNAQVRESVVEQLRSLGYDVTEAVDGASALVRFSENLWPYDLLLTDVIMPGPLNGKALADEVARRWPEVRIVFMSGYTEDAIIHQGRLDPGVRLLPKPFRKAELARAVREALDTANINSAGGPAGIRYPTP
jgi:CheY-like chemotaxis protein